jgi:tetratricopeptide (TPR) repeat protein
MMTIRSRRQASTLAALAVLALAAPARAEYAPAQLATVPVARLVENLQKILDKNPKDVQTRFNLARVHAMAYALKADTAQVRKGREHAGAWFGYEPRPVPFVVKPTSDAGKQDAARKHLEKAIRLYEEVIKQRPDDLIAQLGHAWCVEQRGNKAEAIKEYRKLAETAWAKEKDLKSARIGWHSITAETARYLIPLLDKEKDKEEIKTLKARAARANRVPRPVTPLAVPLRSGLRARDLLDPSARVAFDLDGLGLPQTWTWLSKDAAWLVLDPQRTGRVTSGLQLFGGVTYWCFWGTGYDALAALDDDGDGVLRGRELDGLALWHDANGNGVCDPGEVRPLAAYGIVALSCRCERVKDRDCIALSRGGVVFADGSKRNTYDVLLRRVPVARAKQQQPDGLAPPKEDKIPGGTAR